MLEYLRFQEDGHWVAPTRVAEATDLALTLARYRLLTIDLHFGPSFHDTMELMRETLRAIDEELGSRYSSEVSSGGVNGI